jgi:hypothetical protein
MDPRSNSGSGLGLSQSGNGMGQMPAIHTPQSFHAPDTAASHFDTAMSPQVDAPSVVTDPVSASGPTVPIAAQPAGIPTSLPLTAPVVMLTSDEQRAQYANPVSPAIQQSGPSDDTDTAFDEEWVQKTREVVQRTQADPYVQSQQLSKLKAQYIKLRYNKDVKVSEE